MVPAGACDCFQICADFDKNSKSVSFHYDETHQFSLVSNSNPSASFYNWTSSDETVGNVDQKGKFTAQKIGATTIKAVKNGSAFEAQVIVVPYSNICKEPYWNFSDDMTATKAKETRNLVGETSTALTYSGDNANIRNIVYAYENGKMNSAAILFQNQTAVVEEAAKFFKERYSYAGFNDNIYLYTDNKKIVIGITLDANLGFVAIYIPYANSDGNTEALNTKTILNIIKKRFNS